MNNYAHMQVDFERNKNLKASGITLLICSLLFIIFFFVQWSLPNIPPPVQEEGIEVNLGNSETGIGDIAPQTPGTPSKTEEPIANTPPAAKPAAQQPQNIATDENETDDAATINKPMKTIVKAKPNNNPPIVAKKPKAEVPPTPPAPKPRAQMGKYSGGNGTGGNNGDSYNGVKNQGIAGGTGDQGKPNGNPNSDSYTGNGGTGNSGVTIRSGLAGRRFAKLPSFEDDFNEPAKVAVDIVVDKNGNVTSATVNPRGTTTTNSNIRSIALRKARELKLNAGNEDDQNGTIVFNFKLRG
ncbi:hypothetical protein ACFOW1_12970 [Parasediminibacterium paludis]|uniref:Outer membrane transport energization protein TonB n=1 Tax=Parasediminibacterium paludis TaxID=908966 RepID=A0ABV8PZD9_9BACT